MIIVQKFGGTSLATSEQREMIVKKIAAQIAQNPQTKFLVVVSAMGRKGAPYATDTLLGLIDKKKTSKDKQDILLSCGEIISAAILGSNFDRFSIKAKIVTGWNMGIFTDDNFTDAKIKKIDTTRIENYFKEYSVVIATGFQGITEEGEITTLGRGGSDITAVALGIALNAKDIEIYTDVEGIMTADPRVVPEAKIINEITYQEVFNLAHDGAKVIHPRAVEIAMQHDVNLWIKSLASQHIGTLITHHDQSSKDKWELSRIITGIANIDGLTHFKINTNNYELQKDYDLLDKLAAKGISLDLISISPYTKAFVVKGNETETVIQILKAAEVDFEYTENCTKITVVGVAMKGKPGVMAKILQPLVELNVPIIQTADSHINISILVESKYATDCIKALHNHLI
ncbi:aspartate kinase [Anaerobranca gottschalkii]|uniref:Aspartokinase n=1 Tax=Anaerobranca gottschalkii DSM 13577 TaxID=1120990 RepID=A0A1H9Z8G6_9FIRM|nr:aspartate kinase [Anaerobranca gottschalkii]SES77887.1 aspartate kinase [Anaerobranca gottschalkii DSM 13577]